MQYALAIRNTLPSEIHEDFYSSDEEIQLAMEEKRLLEEISKCETTIKETSTLIEETNKVLNEVNGELGEEVDSLDTFLQAQLDIAEDDKAQQKFKFDDFDFDEDDEDVEDILERLADKNKNSQGNRDLRKRCKYLFKKIANLCHPDKVGHSHLVEIYQEALRACEKLQLSILEDIYEELKANKSGIKSIRERARKQLKLRIQELQNKLDELSEELEDLVAGDEYNYAMLHRKYGKEYAIREHRSELMRSRYELRAALTKLGFDPDNLPF